MKQDDLIQIKVSKRFKKMLKNLATVRGLPLSTYIKFVLSEQLKEDPLWNEIEDKEDQTKRLEDFLFKLEKSAAKGGSKKKIITKL